MAKTNKTHPPTPKNNNNKKKPKQIQKANDQKDK